MKNKQCNVYHFDKRQVIKSTGLDSGLKQKIDTKMLYLMIFSTYMMNWVWTMLLDILFSFVVCVSQLFFLCLWAARNDATADTQIRRYLLKFYQTDETSICTCVFDQDFVNFDNISKGTSTDTIKWNFFGVKLLFVNSGDIKYILCVTCNHALLYVPTLSSVSQVGGPWM